MDVEGGKNVIIDHVMLNGDNGACDELMDCVRFFHGIRVMFVYVKCPIDELARREKARGDRETGNAEKQSAHLLSEGMYDFTVDTYANTVEKCAELIIEKQQNILYTPHFVTVFERMYTESISSPQAINYKWIRG